MHVSRRLMSLAMTMVLVFAVTAPSLAQTGSPTRTVVPTKEPTAEPVAAEKEATVTPGAESVLDTALAGSLELTIYNQSMGLVRQVRSAELDKGPNVISVTDIPAQIIPASVYVTPLAESGGMSVLEQRFDYDVVNSASLLQRYIDQAITLTTQNGESVTGKLISASDDVVLLTDWGIEIIRQSQIQQISLPALAVPPVTRPTLSWLLQAESAGTQDYRVTYLTGGITWQADYVAMLNEDDTEMDLQSWISIQNSSGASYEQAKVKLVAGEINQVQNQARLAEGAVYKVMDAAASPAVAERGIMDYHLYDVARPVTVGDNQTKQIEFLRADRVTVEKQYVYESTPVIWVGLGSAVTDSSYGIDQQADIQVQLQLKNDEKNGLGVPIPQGTVRIYKNDTDGSAILVGQDTVSHTPENEIVRLSLGNAFDLVGERTQTGFRQLGERSIEETIKITLRNQSEKTVTIQVLEHLYRAQDAEITESSADFTKVDASTVQFEVSVEPAGEQTITYTAVYRW
jgi:hypothetical protein